MWRKTSPSYLDLLDVNVWLALSSPDHLHHVRAHRYWVDESAERVAFCRVTVLALLRHLTNQRIMGPATLSGSQAWDEMERWMGLPEVIYLDEPEDLDGRLREYARSLALGPATWTDAYLAAFSVAASNRLVTFDAGMARYQNVDLLHLTI